MRRIKAIKTETGVAPDWPAGQNFPPNDPNVEGVVCTGEEYIIYETGDELPESVRPKLHVLRDLPDDTALWRYIDFARLYSLVAQRALYFTPAYMLRDLEPYELRVPVSISSSNRDAWISSYKQHFPDDPDGISVFERFQQSAEDSLLYGLGISCWHVNSDENSALWQIYVPNTSGVAIKTTLGRLKQGINCRRRYITADIVEYIDYFSEGYKAHPSAIGFEQIYHKAKFFEYEREFRLAYRYDRNLKEFEMSEQALQVASPKQSQEMRDQLHLQREDFLRTGPYVPVEPTVLISEIVVSPHAGSWFFQLVAGLIRTNVSPDIPVRRSAVGAWKDP